MEMNGGSASRALLTSRCVCVFGRSGVSLKEGFLDFHGRCGSTSIVQFGTSARSLLVSNFGVFTNSRAHCQQMIFLGHPGPRCWDSIFLAFSLLLLEI